MEPKMLLLLEVLLVLGAMSGILVGVHRTGQATADRLNQEVVLKAEAAAESDKRHPSEFRADIGRAVAEAVRGARPTSGQVLSPRDRIPARRRRAGMSESAVSSGRNDDPAVV